jgi:hypothetical protein
MSESHTEEMDPKKPHIYMITVYCHVCYKLNCTRSFAVYQNDHISHVWTVSWKNHINYVIAKLNSACFAIRTVKSLLLKDALKMLYFSYIHSVISYGIIFWSNSPYSIKIFKIQKKIIRIIII